MRKVKLYWMVILGSAGVYYLILTFLSEPVYQAVYGKEAVNMARPRPEAIELDQLQKDNTKSFLLLQALMILLLAFMNAFLLLGTVALILVHSIKKRKIAPKPTKTVKCEDPKSKSAGQNQGKRENNWVGKMKIPSKELNISLFTIILSSTQMLFLFYVYLDRQPGLFFVDFKRAVIHFYSDTIRGLSRIPISLLGVETGNRSLQKVSLQIKIAFRPHFCVF